jgi:urocanate hydratase
MTERAEDPQLEALRAFTLLGALRQDWRGALIVACGLGRGGSALSVAANIAGAGCLAIDPRTDVCRAALRSGSSDFVVNTVDEALRVLKNEIRQRRAVSVGLTLGLHVALEELLDRGVLPELFTAIQRDFAGADFDVAACDGATLAFEKLGSAVVGFDESLSGSGGVVDAEGRLEAFTRERGLQLESFAFASAEELRTFDGRLLEVVPATDARRNWCAAASRFFHRERPYRRVVYLTAEERDRVAAALR